jgi:hypothetical protein
MRRCPARSEGPRRRIWRSWLAEPRPTCSASSFAVFDDPIKVELMLKDIGITLELGREAQLPMPLSGLGPQLWRAAARAAGDGASVSEMPRWVEPPYGTAVTPGPGTDTTGVAAAAIPARNS